MGELVEVFSSPNPKDCSERGLVLRAKDISYQVGQRGHIHSIWVNDREFHAAVNELRSYDRENADWPPRAAPAPPRAPYAMQGCVLTGALLILFHVFAIEHAWGLDWERAGRASSSLILHGEPWRALTALFLHAGLPHILANLTFGLFFGYLVAIGHGGGLGLAATLLAGSLGNGLNAWLQGPGHLSIGYSTAVFGALGVLAGSEWKRRWLLREGRLRRLAPVLLALTVLAMYGIPQEVQNVDVGAHAMGFVAGLCVGVPLPWMLARGFGSRSWQIAWGILSLLAVALAWGMALTGTP